MGTSRDLPKPSNEEDLEALCHQLYRSLWLDPGCTRVGRRGQGQAGVDILGRQGDSRIGVQCKNYLKTPFTLETVKKDIAKVEEKGLTLNHLIFATSADSDSEVTLQVAELSDQRRKRGLFTVSVDFWPDICGHINVVPEVGRAFIRDFPGSAALEAVEGIQVVRDLVQSGFQDSQAQHAQLREQVATVCALLEARALNGAVPNASGSEVDPVVVAKLDMVRDHLHAGRSGDAKRILESMGDYRQFKDEFSKFRWLSNTATVDLLNGSTQIAAETYLEAKKFAPDNEKAVANAAHALLLLGDAENALAQAESGLELYPQSEAIWALRMHARHRLGMTPIDEQMPSKVRESDELRYSYASLLGRMGRHQDAIELLKKCSEGDSVSSEVKRALLVEALSLATKDNVLVALDHLQEIARTELHRAVELLEPLEETILEQQSTSISAELSCNSATALMVLGDTSRAKAIAQQMLRRHPEEEALLRVQIVTLVDEGKVDEVKRIFQGKEGGQSASILVILLDVAIDLEDAAWFGEIRHAIESRSLSDVQRADVEVQELRLELITGDADQAITKIGKLTKASPDNIRLRVLYAQALIKAGDEQAAAAEIEDCFQHVKAEKMSTFQWFQIAETSFELSSYTVAAESYRKIISAPGSDALTRKLIYCYLRLDRRGEAWALLGKLPADARASPMMARLECDLAQASSDWARLEELASDLINMGSSDIGSVFAKAVALYRLGKREQSKEFLARYWMFDFQDPAREFELAKLELAAELPAQGLRRVLSLFAKNPEDARVAGQYLSYLFLMRPSENGPASDLVTVDVAVLLESEAESFSVAIADLGAGIRGWTEIVSSNSVLAAELLALRLGDVVSVDRGFIKVDARVASIKPLWAFVAEKAHKVLERSSSHEGPLWRIPASLPDGKPNIESLSKVATTASDLAELVLAQYEKRVIPLSCLAKFLNVELAAVTAKWPGPEHKLWVSSGSPTQLEDDQKLLRSADQTFALDLLTLSELVRWEAFDAVLAVIGTPLLAQSAKDAIEAMLETESRLKPLGLMGQRNGRLSLQQTSENSHNKWLKYLGRLSAAASRCRLMPARGSAASPDELTVISSMFESTTLDTLLLCGEHNVVLLTDDEILRGASGFAGVSKSMSLQPVLMKARDGGKLSEHQYASIVTGKLRAGHRFVSIASNDLISVSLDRTQDGDSRVMAVLDSFSESNLDALSAIRVVIGFIAAVAWKLPPRRVARHVRAAVRALMREEPSWNRVVVQTFSRLLWKLYGRNGRRLKPGDRREFGTLMLRRSAGVL